jgi:hypothetical protein
VIVCVFVFLDKSEKNLLDFFLASRDLVRNVNVVAPVGDSDHLRANTKSFIYGISWSKPLKPNGLIYFYFIYVGQDSNNGLKEERCVAHYTYSINVTLSPKTTYRLRIITYTVARLNNEYGDRQLINDGLNSMNSTNLFFEFIFTTKDLPSRIDRKSFICYCRCY